MRIGPSGARGARAAIVLIRDGGIGVIKPLHWIQMDGLVANYDDGSQANLCRSEVLSLGGRETQHRVKKVVDRVHLPKSSPKRSTPSTVAEKASRRSIHR